MKNRNHSIKNMWQIILVIFLIAGTIAPAFQAGKALFSQSEVYVEPALYVKETETISVIVSAQNSQTAAQAVQQAGGEVTSDLWVIDAVAATLPANQLQTLAAIPGLHSVVDNKGVRTADEWDGWVTGRRIKKATFPLGDKFKGSITPLADGGAIAVSENGKVLMINGDGTLRANFTLNQGKPFYTTPHEGANGLIFLAGEGHRVFAINPNGTLRWTFSEGGSAKFVGGVVLNPDGTTVYAGDEGRILYAIDGNTGKKLWQFKANAGDKFVSTPVVGNDGTIYNVTENGYLYALNPSGTVKWNYFAADGKPFKLGPILGGNGNLYFAGEEKRVYSVQATTGTLVYSFQTNSKIRAQPVVGSDGSLYVAAEDRSLYALNPNGSMRFEFRPSSGHFLTSPALSSDESLVYVAIKEKKLFAINSLTGLEAWHYTSNDDLLAGPVVDQSGDILLGNEAGEFTIFKSNGLVASQFTQFQPVKFHPVVNGNTNVFVPSGDETIEMLSRLPDHWNGQPDVIPTENNKVYKLVNPVTIDLGADVLHATLDANGTPITGEGITVAVLDTGVYFTGEVKQVLGQQVLKLFKGQVDFVGDGVCAEPPITKGQYKDSIVQYDGYCWTNHYKSQDGYGHGSHVAGTIWSNFTDYDTGVFMGVAPDANVLSVRVLGNAGEGTYEDVIEGIQYVIANKDVQNIRIINMSLSATPTTPYFVDPINRTVEAAWQAGIVVLAAAGNTGPGADTVSVPGNDPYIITVGAINNARTPGYWLDDYLPKWSATGPTLDGFVKPDVLAPGSQIVSFMYNDPSNANNSAYLVKEHPDYSATQSLYRMNGTSMATGITSGVVALMLQANPNLTPDQVKFRLMYTARQMTTDTGQMGLNLLQQGAGRIWAPDAVLANVPNGNANAGMDLAADLAHGWGYYDASGNPVLDEAEMAFHYLGPVRKLLSQDGQRYLFYVDNGDGTSVALGVTDALTGEWLAGEQIAGNTSWTSGMMVWSGGNMVWSGNNLEWTTEALFDASGNMIWSGGRMVWSGSELFDTAGNMIWSGGNLFDASGNMVWSGGNMVWSGGNMVWSGGNMVWSGGNMVWSGGNMVWSGGNMVWSGGNMVWSGGNMVWSGGNMVWSGGNMVWSGGNMIWSGTTDWANAIDPQFASITSNLWVDW